MLILSRKLNESIIIDSEVTVTILSVKGSQVRLGIDAPKDVSVHREEIYQRIIDSADDEKQQPVVKPFGKKTLSLTD